jgi:hypothetical protein
VVNVVQWMRTLRRKWVKRQDAIAAEKVLLDHELSERNSTGDPRTAIPGMRETPFFDGHQGGL